MTTTHKRKRGEHKTRHPWSNATTPRVTVKRGEEKYSYEDAEWLKWYASDDGWRPPLYRP